MASLSERVAAAKAATSTTFDTQREDMFKQLRGKLHFKIVEELGPTLYDRQMSDAELRLRVLEMLEWALDQEDGVPLTRADRTQLLNEIASDVLGYGPIDPVLQDPDVTEVMVNGPNRVFVERFGKIEQADVRFVDATHLRRIIDKIVGSVGRRIDEVDTNGRCASGGWVACERHHPSPLALGRSFHSQSVSFPNRSSWTANGTSIARDSSDRRARCSTFSTRLCSKPG